MAPHVVAFNGSPRKQGNTEKMLESALEGARQAGATTQVFRLSDLDFSPCQNCGACEKKGACRFASDGMGPVYQALDESDLFIAGSPVYFSTVSAQFKKMVDRCQALWARKYLLSRPHPRKDERKGIMLSVGGFKHRQFWPCTEKVVKVWCVCLDIEYLGGLFYHAVDERGVVGQHPTALEEAFDAGRRLVAGQGPDPKAQGAEKP